MSMLSAPWLGGSPSRPRYVSILCRRLSTDWLNSLLTGVGVHPLNGGVGIVSRFEAACSICEFSFRVGIRVQVEYIGTRSVHAWCTRSLTTRTFSTLSRSTFHLMQSDHAHSAPKGYLYLLPSAIHCTPPSANVSGLGRTGLTACFAGFRLCMLTAAGQLIIAWHDIARD